MALSVGLSLVIYRLSRDELIINTRRQVYFFNDALTQSDFNTFSRLRQRQLSQGLARLRADLFLFNLFVLTAGGAASYGLARRTLKPIEESLEAQKRFAADASHELRTPLAAIQSEIEVALRNKEITKKEAVELLRSNLEEVAKLKTLSEGLLRLASEEGRQTHRRTVSIKAVADQAVARIQKIALTKKIKISTRLDEGFVKGDEQSLVDLVTILLDNAVKYSPPGATVTVRAYAKDKTASISVADRGRGISAGELPRIFERFYRTDSSRSRESSGGYGLGLAIAKKIAEMHAGIIEVKSAPGKGSSFTVVLPLKQR